VAHRSLDILCFDRELKRPTHGQLMVMLVWFDTEITHWLAKFAAHKTELRHSKVLFVTDSSLACQQPTRGRTLSPPRRKREVLPVFSISSARGGYGYALASVPRLTYFQLRVRNVLWIVTSKLLIATDKLYSVPPKLR